MYGSHSFEVDLTVGIRQLLLHLLEQLFALDGTFIQLLLQSRFLDCLVGNVIKLGDQKVVHLSLCVTGHNSHDISDFPLEVNDLLAQLSPHLLISDLPDHFLILINLLVRLLYDLIDLPALLEVLLLQSLNVVE